MGLVRVKMGKDQQQEAAVEVSRLQESLERSSRRSSVDTQPTEEMNDPPFVVKMGLEDMEMRQNMVVQDMGLEDMEMAEDLQINERPLKTQASGSCEGISPHGDGSCRENLKLLQGAYLSMKGDPSAPSSGDSNVLHEESIFLQFSPVGNTVLHVAAMCGNDEMVKKAAEKAPALLTEQNDSGDTALHVAARAGHISTLKMWLTAHLSNLSVPYSVEPEPALYRMFLMKNKLGNTFLHEALYGRHEDVLKFLLSDEQQFFEAGFKELVERAILLQTNEENKSVLYLVIEAGDKGLVDQALTKLYNPHHPDLIELTQNHEELIEFIPHDSNHIPPGKSPLLAAILKRDPGILDIILTRKPEWIHLRDKERRTPLHYAASMGYIEGVQYLLRKCASCANARDKYGFFPLHLASDGGHVEVVHKLLQQEYCPYPREILDNVGRNILHLAIESGKFNVVRYILRAANHELQKMINDKDASGNTPLHLASLRCHPRIVHALTWDKRVDLTLVNSKNQTALDACKLSEIKNPSLRQRLTWIALKSAGVQCGGTPPSSVKVPPQITKTCWEQEAPNMDQYKDRINTLLLVSTLIITATFAAGVTIPGGTNSSNPGQGMAAMLNHIWFKLFIFFITISMYGAISVTIILIWAQLGDITLALLALKVARPLLGVTLATLSLAFLAGVHLVISDLSWLATTFLVMCVIFIFILLLLYILVWFPSSSSIPIVRYISYYPFLFLASLVDHDQTSAICNRLDSSHSMPEV